MRSIYNPPPRPANAVATVSKNPMRPGGLRRGANQPPPPPERLGVPARSIDGAARRLLAMLVFVYVLVLLTVLPLPVLGILSGRLRLRE